MRFKPVWSDAFMLGLIGLAATPLLPAPDWYPALSLDTATGRRIYIAGLVLLGIGFFVVRGLENAVEARGQAQRDKEANDMHAAGIALQRQHYESVITHQKQTFESTIATMAKQHSELVAYHEQTVAFVATLSKQFAGLVAGAPIPDAEREQLIEMFEYIVDQLDQVSKNYTVAAETLSTLTELVGLPFFDMPSEAEIAEARETLREWVGKRAQATLLLSDRAARLKLPGGGMVPPTLPSAPNT
jgi:flagellar hook protein FlgE